MEWKTHLLSGVVAGYSITGGDWRGALIGGVAGIVPDLDEPKSKFGKIFFFISIPLSMFFAHRTFTHSLLFVLLSSVLALTFLDSDMTLAIIAGLLSHIVADMLTGKVQLFYPYKKGVGIPIPRSFFIFIDRVTRYVLLLVVIWWLWEKVMHISI